METSFECVIVIVIVLVAGLAPVWSAFDLEDPRGVPRSHHGDALVHSVAQGVRRRGGATNRSSQLPPARREPGTSAC